MEELKYNTQRRQEKGLNRDVYNKIHMYKREYNKERIIALYTGDYKHELYLREISRLANMPLKTTQNTLQALEKTNIIKSDVHGRNKYFHLNRENIHTKLLLVNAELYKTAQFLEKYPPFKVFLKEYNVTTPLLVFGSYAKGTARKESDLDLLMIAPKNQQLPSHFLPYKLHIIYLAEEQVHLAMEKREALMQEVQEHHIVLNNHSFFVNMFWSYYGR